MDWNGAIIELSNDVVTEENVNEFNMDFYEKVASEHDSDIKAGSVISNTVTVWGMELVVDYVAAVDDEEYPDETEPCDIELVSLNGKTEEEFLEDD